MKFNNFPTHFNQCTLSSKTNPIPCFHHIPTMTSIETEHLINPLQTPSNPPKHEPDPTRPISLITHPLQWLNSLSTSLTPSFIAGIFLVYGLNLGFASSIFRVVSDYYWKDIQKARPSSAQFYVALYYIPWIMKPIWGLLTDVFPVAGYKRRPYLVVSGVIGVVSTVVLTTVTGLPAALALVCMVGGTAGMAISGVTIDACIAKNSIEVKELAADLQSLCGFCNSSGALVGFSVSGVAVHWLGAQGAFGLLAIPPAAILVLGFLIHEERIIYTTDFSQKKVVERVGGAIRDMSKTIKIPQVWKPSLFMFLSLAISYSTHEGHFYWYTNSEVGPGFSQEFVGMIYAIGAVGSIIGVLIYHTVLKDFPFRNLIFYMQLLYAVSGMMDLIFVLRWNLILGIPDSFFIIMEETVLHMITRLRWMPMVVLSTKLCPLGIEGTFFALLMCIDSIGLLSSKMVGGLVLHLLNISRTNFTNLWLAVLIRNCLRFSTLAFIFLIPNATQYDDLVPSDASAKSSSCKASKEEEATLQLVPLNEEI